jgi:uncharacterized RDD family membrane protein YckC
VNAAEVTAGRVGSVEQTEVAVASIGRRFGALLIDWILCLLISGLFSKPSDSPWLAPSVLVLEYGLFVGFFAQTPGMFVTRIRCVSVHDGGAIGAPRALLRGLLLALLVPAVIMNGQQRGLHDRAAGSIMLRG